MIFFRTLSISKPISSLSLDSSIEVSLISAGDSDGSLVQPAIPQSIDAASISATTLLLFLSNPCLILLNIINTLSVVLKKFKASLLLLVIIFSIHIYDDLFYLILIKPYFDTVALVIGIKLIIRRIIITIIWFTK